MIMNKKIFIAIVMAAMVVSGGLFYWFWPYDNEVASNDDAYIPSQPIIKWQEITIAEDDPKMAIRIKMPRIIIYSNYYIGSEVSRAIQRHIESLKHDFISAATTAAIDNGETNILNVETEILLATPKLISLAFISTEDLMSINDDGPKRTFVIFDLINNKMMIEGNEMFRDDIAWSRAATIMKKTILADYQGDPSCDLSFAPKHNGVAVSCIGVDYSRGGGYLSLTKDMPISVIQEFLAPSALVDIIQ